MIGSRSFHDSFIPEFGQHLQHVDANLLRGIVRPLYRLRGDRPVSVYGHATYRSGTAGNLHGCLFYTACFLCLQPRKIRTSRPMISSARITSKAMMAFCQPYSPVWIAPSLYWRLLTTVYIWFLAARRLLVAPGAEHALAVGLLVVQHEVLDVAVSPLMETVDPLPPFPALKKP